MPGFPARFPVCEGDRRSLRYRLTVLFIGGVLRLWGRRLRIEGEERIPADGPLIVVSNHLSNVDPLLFGALFPRTLFAMAKRELFANRLLAWYFAGINCIPVDRGTADRWAVKTALAILGRGGRLLLFLEGTRSRSGVMARAEPGIGFLLRHSKARLLPAAVWGTEKVLSPGRRLPRRAPMTLRYGEPFSLELEGRGRDDQAIADEVAARVAELLPEGYRGWYAA